MPVKSPLFVNNPEKKSKSFLSLRMFFNLIFLASLGLNVYFLVFKNELSSIASANDVKLEEKEIIEESQFFDPGLKTNVHEEDPVQNFNSVRPPSHKVEKILFDSSTQSNAPSIQVLKLKVKNSLNYTACQQIKLGSECGAFAAHAARLLAWFLDINKEMHNGDDLNVVYERLDKEGQFKILQLTYKSTYLKKTLEANYYKKKGEKYGGYFDRYGKEITQRIVKKQSPIDSYVEIVSLPGDFRKGRRGHSGTDFKAEIGTPVRSTFDGRIIRINWNRRANGYCIEIDHPNQKIKTRYLHLSRVLVKRGEYVKQGALIGESGNTGRSFAPHLHYEVRSRGKKKIVYNPFDFKYHKTYHRNIADQASGEFQKTISYYDAFYENNKTGNDVGTG
jgi:murein DD-endopeptidase MepM/ murein hydrolase activator NlpD